MRNDARPIGEDAQDKSPIDERESAAHDRQSHIVNRRAEEDAKRKQSDQTMPSDGSSTLNTRI